MRVDNKNERSAVAEDHVRVERGIEEIDLTGEVPNLKLHEAGNERFLGQRSSEKVDSKPGVVDIVFDDFVCALEEECLVRAHFMEDYLEETGLRVNFHILHIPFYKI